MAKTQGVAIRPMPSAISHKPWRALVARIRSDCSKRGGMASPSTPCRLAARNMAGASEKYEHLPYFYSDLFDLGYEAVGEFGVDMEIVEDWKQPFRQGVVYYLKAGRVRGVLLWNTWGQVDAARGLIVAKNTFTAAALVGRIHE